MTSTRHLVAVAAPVPVLSPREYSARYLRQSACTGTDCVLAAGHRGTCLPAPRRDQQDGAR